MHVSTAIEYLPNSLTQGLCCLRLVTFLLQNDKEPSQLTVLSFHRGNILAQQFQLLSGFITSLALVLNAGDDMLRGVHNLGRNLLPLLVVLAGRTYYGERIKVSIYFKGEKARKGTGEGGRERGEKGQKH